MITWNSSRLVMLEKQGGEGEATETRSGLNSYNWYSYIDFWTEFFPEFQENSH